MSSGSIIWIAALAWLLYRQTQRRPIGRGSGARGGRRQIAVILLVLGALELAVFARHHHIGAAAVGVLALSFLVGAALGVARGFTVRLEFDGGQLYRQGTLLTVALWLLAVGLHLASEPLVRDAGGSSGTSSATMLLYLALSLTIQSRVLAHRARARVVARRAQPEAAAG